MPVEAGDVAEVRNETGAQVAASKTVIVITHIDSSESKTFS